MRSAKIGIFSETFPNGTLIHQPTPELGVWVSTSPNHPFQFIHSWLFSDFSDILPFFEIATAAFFKFIWSNLGQHFDDASSFFSNRMFCLSFNSFWFCMWLVVLLSLISAGTFDDGFDGFLDFLGQFGSILGFSRIFLAYSPSRSLEALGGYDGWSWSGWLPVFPASSAAVTRRPVACVTIVVSPGFGWVFRVLHCSWTVAPAAWSGSSKIE